MKRCCRIPNPFLKRPNRSLTAVDVPEEYMVPSIHLCTGTPVPVGTRGTNNPQWASGVTGPSCGDNAPDIHFDTTGLGVDTHAQSIQSGRAGVCDSLAEKCKTDPVSCIRGLVSVLTVGGVNSCSQPGPPIGGDPTSHTLSEKAGAGAGNNTDTGNWPDSAKLSKIFWLLLSHPGPRFGYPSAGFPASTRGTGPGNCPSSFSSIVPSPGLRVVADMTTSSGEGTFFDPPFLFFGIVRYPL